MNKLWCTNVRGVVALCMELWHCGNPGVAGIACLPPDLLYTFKPAFNFASSFCCHIFQLFKFWLKVSGMIQIISPLSYVDMPFPEIRQLSDGLSNSERKFIQAIALSLMNSLCNKISPRQLQIHHNFHSLSLLDAVVYLAPSPPFMLQITIALCWMFLCPAIWKRESVKKNPFLCNIWPF